MVPPFQQEVAAIGTLPFTSPQQSRKRKVSTFNVMPAASKQRPFLKPTDMHEPTFNLLDLNQKHGECSLTHPAISNSNVISATGLCLAFFDDDDGSAFSTSRVGGASANRFGEELFGQILLQQNELQQLFKSHAEQLQDALKQQTDARSRSLLASLEGLLSRSLCDKDLELARVKRYKSDLEQRIKQLVLEANLWQSKARSYEAMVTALKVSIQQAIMHENQEQIKLEGCGDSGADDEASAYVDENAQIPRIGSALAAGRAEPNRPCRRCHMREVTILLLPCMHLSLCQDCKLAVEKCPICSIQISAFIEVFLS
ncbi:hypothetical protein KP509_13G086300 [Ceratopteris richardii]|nr:hypothetical protein KP509_13G086300 [Ceratopteris richardii]